MKFKVVIPARYASSRLPAKPLADICGQTMIERVYRQAKLSEAETVIVATDHAEIYDEVKRFGGEVVMTRTDHESGTDRLAEVVQTLELCETDIVVNVQGDEPFMPPEVINQVARNLHHSQQASVATVSEPIVSTEQYLNPNAVKVVADTSGHALYFSRAPIPWNRDLLALQDDADITAFLNGSTQSGAKPVQKHIGIYAYKVSLLQAFVTWPLGQLEAIEKLEQLRVMENGHRLHVEPAVSPVPVGIDTQEDLDAARKLVQSVCEK